MKTRSQYFLMNLGAPASCRQTDLSAGKMPALPVATRGLLILLIALLQTMSFCSATERSVQSLKVHLESDSQGQLRVLIGGKLAATFSDPNGKAQSFDTNSMHLYRVKANDITLETRSIPLQVTMEGFPGWEANLPGLSSTSCQIDQQLKQVNIQTGSGNREAVAVTLPDGALASLSSHSRGRMALFKDGSYSFYGDGVVTAVSADGKTNVLSRKLPPLRGGPLREIIDTNGIPRLTRVTPLVKLVMGGDVGGPITIEGGGQRTVLEPDVDPPIEFPNGSLVNFDNLATSKQVKCQVIKGDMELSISGIEGWKTVLQSGQTIACEFDRSRQMVDVTYSDSDSGQAVLVMLPSKTIAVIEGKSTFQYAFVDRKTFATSATGVGVQLYDTRTSRETKLTEENFLFVGGIAQRNGARQTGSESVAIVWDKGVPFELNGLSGSASIPPGEAKIMKTADDKELSINYNQNGDLEMQAIQGNYTFRLSALHGMSLNLAMGDTVILSLDLKQGTFIVRSGDENGSPVRLTTAEGFSPSIPPSGALNFNLGKDGALTATSSTGQVMDFAPAGSGNNAVGGEAGVNSGKNTSLDVSRIAEAALSVKR